MQYIIYMHTYIYHRYMYILYIDRPHVISARGFAEVVEELIATLLPQAFPQIAQVQPQLAPALVTHDFEWCP